MTQGKEWLFAGLEIPERRRLYFLLLALEQRDLADALKLAADVESYINDHRYHGAGETARGQLQKSEDEMLRQGAAAPRPPKIDIAVTANGAKSSPTDKPRRPPLDQNAREEFIKASAAGVDNQQLAARFGLTPRQAQGLRIGLARSKSLVHRNGHGHTEVVKDRPDPNSLSDHRSEIQQQEAFLRDRKPPPATTEDVVRFLRQIGDTVVSKDGGFLLNYRMHLTLAQLVQRANEKRLARGKPAFILTGDDQRCAEAATVDVATMTPLDGDEGTPQKTTFLGATSRSD